LGELLIFFNYNDLLKVYSFYFQYKNFQIQLSKYTNKQKGLMIYWFYDILINFLIKFDNLITRTTTAIQ